MRDEPADTAVGILRDLKMDCDTMDKVRLLVSMWKNGISPEKTAIRRVMSKVGPMFDSLTAFQEAFADEICFGGTDESVVPEGKLSGEADAATVPKGKLSVETGESVVPEESLSVETGATALPKEKLSDDASQDAIPYREILPTVKTLAEEIRAAGDPLTLKDLAVTGRDLMAYGIKPGPEFGRTLNRMLDMVLEHPAYNRKDFLLAQCFGPETK